MPAIKQPCGTRAAWRRHRENGEEPCSPCQQANDEYNRNRERCRPMRPCPECGRMTRAVDECLECRLKESPAALEDGEWVVRRGVKVWVSDPCPPIPIRQKFIGKPVAKGECNVCAVPVLPRRIYCDRCATEQRRASWRAAQARKTERKKAAA